MTKQVTVGVPESALAVLREEPTQFGRTTYETAVVKWFEEGRLSQDQAAEILGLKRGEFFDVLYKHHVSPVQVSVEDLEKDFRRV
jgi:predicted HTH domain antitoxin